MELLENTLKELEVKEKAVKSLEAYYVKDLCPNFKDRFKGFEIQDIDSYENYNLQNIMDDLRHIQVLLQGSPSKTSFKQKREFLAKLGQEMLELVKKLHGIKTTPAPPAKAKPLVPTKIDVKLPPLNAKAQPQDGIPKNSMPSVPKAPKKDDGRKISVRPQGKEEEPKVPVPVAAAEKKEPIKRTGSFYDKSAKAFSLPEILEERIGEEDGQKKKEKGDMRRDSFALSDSLALTPEQEHMLEQTLKKHGLKADVWTGYLEMKLNNYNQFGHHTRRKDDYKLDLHLEIAKFEQEYERYIVRKNRNIRSLNLSSSKGSLLLTNSVSPNSNSNYRTKSQNKDVNYTESGAYMLPSVRRDDDKSSTKSSSRQETSLDETLHTTPKKKFSSFKFNNSQTPQKTNPIASEGDLDYTYGRQRRDQLSLDFTSTSRRFKVSPSPIMAFRLNSKDTDTDAMSSDLKSQKSLKKMLTQTSKNFSTIKKSHMFTSNLLEKETETVDEDSNKKTLKASDLTLNTINSAMVASSHRFTKFESQVIGNVRSPIRASHLVSKFQNGKRESHVNPWGEASAANHTMKTINSRSCTTIASVDATSRVFQLRSPLSEIRTSELLDLEYANTVRRIRLLGAGSEAKVFLCQIQEFEEIVALKQYDLVKDKKSSLQAYESLKKEFDMLRQLNHDNIIKYLSLYKPRKTAYSNCIEFGIIMEYISGGSLEAYIDNQYDEISFQTKRSIMKQILQGLDHLHQHKIIHRDLKPGNILLTEDKATVRITDFGISIKTTTDTNAKRTWVGTPWYMAPEVINQETYSSKADIWSAGCCFLHLLTGKKPYNNANAIQALMLMVNHENPLEYCDKETITELYKQEGVKDLLESCFRRSKLDRPSAAKLLENVVFADMD